MGDLDGLNAGGPHRLGRRTFVRRVATAGTVAWAAPAILTMNPAAAASLTSPPPGGPGDPDDPDVLGTTDIVDPGVEAPPQVLGTQVARAGELPRTGADLDQIAVAGLAAAAGGGAMMMWSSELRKSAPEPLGAADEA